LTRSNRGCAINPPGSPRRTLRECQLLAHAVARLLDDPAKISY